MKRAKAWLDAKRIDVRTAFGFTPEQQPLVLNNTPQSHAALYFQDLDGNSLEFITPLRLDVNEHHPKMTLDEWLAIHEEA
ncbi:MAG TPA: hypothetical protein VFK44_03700 [Bacillales bacterium]|nr:hypothetical protein [Bacillales bacterium]